MPEWEAGHTTFKLDVEAGTLTVTGELDFGVERDFQRACVELLEGEAKRVLVDLSDVKFVCSSCLGALFLLYERAKPRGVGVGLRLGRRVAPICRMMGVHELMDVEEVG